jgi:predicted Zn-dependent peptidase
MKAAVLGVMVAFVWSALAQAKEAPPVGGSPKAFTLPRMDRFELPNGLRVTLVPFGTIPKATVSLVLRFGNIVESASQVWLSDLAGALLKEGTTTKTAREVAVAAASMGGRVQVAVHEDETTVGGAVLSELAPEFVRLVSEIVLAPRFPQDAFERVKKDLLRRLVLQESQSQAIAQKKLRSVMYGGHPYGRTVPTHEALAGYTLPQARALWADHAGAARAHLYVVGRFDEGAVRAAVSAAFGGWARGNSFEAPASNPRRTRSVSVVDRKSAVQSTVIVSTPVVPASHPDAIALRVTNALLGGSFMSRITSNIREKRGYTYSPRGTIENRSQGSSWVELADVTTKVTGPALREILEEVRRLRQQAPSVAELEGIQNYLCGFFVLGLSSQEGLLAQLRFVDLHGLGEGYLRAFVDRVRAVTPDDVRRMAEKYLVLEAMTIVVVGDRSVVDAQLEKF